MTNQEISGIGMEITPFRSGPFTVYEYEGNLMVGPYALNNDEADELLEWFKKRHRVKASEPARREHEALLRAMREQQQPEPAPPRDDLADAPFCL